METIIGILMILLPVVFKLIGKRLEQAGKNQPPVNVMEEESPVENWEQTLREYLEQQTVVDEVPSVVEPVVPEPMSVDSVEAPVAPVVQASSNDGEIVAAIIAAIESYRAANGSTAPGGFRVVSFRKRI